MSEVLNQNNDQIREQRSRHDNEDQPVRRRGRPKGSKNLTTRKPRPEGWGQFGKPRSLAAHRKWQRGSVLPQFVMSRKQAQDILVKFLRSKAGKPALTLIVNEGFAGLLKMPDNKMCEFLASTNLLSRYPHEVVIRGV